MTAAPPTLRTPPRPGSRARSRTGGIGGRVWRVRAPMGRFSVALAVLLGGYMFFGRPFAYLHVPGIPVYVGEAVLALGILEALPLIKTLPRLIRESLPLRILIALVLLGMTRLVLVDLPPWGLQAARDAALVYYALTVPLVGLTIRSDPTVLTRWLGWYERVIPAYLLWAPVSVAVGILFTSSAPYVPDSVTPVVQVKPGDVGVFCGMAVAYLWVRPGRSGVLGRMPNFWTTLGLLGLIVAGTQNRGGLLSGTFIVVGGILQARRRGRIAATVVATLAFVLLTSFAFDLRADLGRREVSAEQLVTNLGSIAGEGEEVDDPGYLRGNVSWRLTYWTDIVNENLFGDRALTGVGFGENLAERYDLPTRSGPQALRNAHNSHLSILARLGVPGMLLWCAFWVVLVAQVASTVRRYRRRHAPNSGRILTWMLLTIVGILGNAIFDPTLEGPQIALWVWTLVGCAAQARFLTAHSGFDQPAPLGLASSGRRDH